MGWFSSDNAAASGVCSDTGTALGDTGDSNTPTLISTPQELAQLSTDSQTTSLSGYYKLTADIDLADCAWAPIGDSNYRFTGTLDGAGHSIHGLSVDVVEEGGLFGQLGGVGEPATVKDLGLIDVEVVTTSQDLAGALSGRALDAAVLRVYATGRVTAARNFAGGLVGAGQNTTFTNTYARVSVEGSDEVGGIIGRGKSGDTANEILYSYAAGGISAVGATYVGGIGSDGNSGPGTVSDSYYDSDLSGQSDTNGGSIPKTTVEMKTFSTFSSSWDIVEGWEAFDFDNPSNVWGICERANDGYPFLLWQYSSDPCVEPTSSSDNSAGPAVSSKDSDTSSPGIFLSVTTSIGNQVSGAEIVFGSYSVAASSPLLLTAHPDGREWDRRVLSSGFVSPSGHLEGTVTLPGLSPGEYVVLLRGVSASGSELILGNRLVVGARGDLVSMTDEAQQPQTR